ncbi:hypothetical protein CJF30_00011107 [Rutstroemia sp. NJR-2017a BBW]|nr:hypothetical protein CJF30_00011107 [Rutstroemia sp. NJR-2017a BBW]
MATGLGEAASIAGVISLAGLTIQATSMLYTFCKTYEDIDVQFRQTGKELENLQNILRQIERFTTDGTLLSTDAISILKARISECQHDIELWNQKLALLGFDKAKGTKRFLTKIKMSADKAYFTKIRERLCIHRAQIDLSLGLLGIDVNLRGIRYSEETENSINALQTDQSTFRDGAFHRLDTVGEDVRQLRSQQSDSLEVICDMVESIHRSYESSAGATKVSIDTIDARLNTMQEQLQWSINYARSSTSQLRPSVSRKSFRRAIPYTARKLEFVGFTPNQVRHISQSAVSTPLRIIKPGLLVQERNRRLVFELVALDDIEYAAADIAQKVALIEHVKSLRLIIWLLKWQNYSSCAELCLGRSIHSIFASQASLASKWQFCDSCSTLRDILEDRHADLGFNIPWIRGQPWLQYLCNRIDEREQDFDLIMEMVLRLWSRFPVPENGQPTFYNLKLPLPLAERFTGLEVDHNAPWIAYLSACLAAANWAEEVVYKEVHILDPWQSYVHMGH